MNKFASLILLLVILFTSCNKNTNYQTKNSKETKPKSELTFDQKKWLHKEGKDFPYREKMYKDVVYNDSIRKLNKDQIHKLLGAPTKTNKGHIYYRIKETRFLGWKLHTRTVVFKFKEDQSIEWIKIHE